MKRQIRQVLPVIVILALAAVGGACSQSASPTAPSALSTVSSATPAAPSAPTTPTGPTPSTGATIVGQVSGTSSGAATGSSAVFRPQTTGLTVTVSGTGMSTTVDGSGQFTLSNVPSGDVTLQFTGPGTNASVTISGVTSGQQLQISVSVSGSSASLDSEHGSDGSVQIEGLIGSIDATGGTIVVNGTTISVPATATITHGSTTLQLSDLQVGQRVHVKGSNQSGTVVATQIMLQDQNPTPEPPQPPAHETEASGTLTAAPSGNCPAVTFTIGATTVTTTASTVFRGGTCSDVAVGVKVDVKGTTTSSSSGVSSSPSSMTATQVSIEQPETETRDVKGTLAAAPSGTCPTVTFTVGSSTVTTSSATTFEGGACTDLAAGVKADAQGTVSGSTVAATKVSIESQNGNGKGKGSDGN